MDHQVDVPGAVLAVDERGSGPPFVWGHGLTSSRAHEDRLGLFDWSPVAERFRLVRYDARGHGQSSGTADPDDYRWPDLAGDLVAVTDALHLDRPVLGGASMGAATTLHLATAAPERVRAMVLVIPPTAWATRRRQTRLYRTGAALVATLGMGPFQALAAAAPTPAIFAGHPELTRFEPAVSRALLPSVLRGAAASDLPAPEALRAVSQPTLILAWDTDPGHPVTTAEALQGLLPDSRLHVARRLEEIRTWPALVDDFLVALAEVGH